MPKPEDTAKLLFKAVKHGDAKTVRTLITKDKSLLQVQDAEKNTPLHWAAWKGEVDVAQTLLDLGANINAVSQNTHWGDTPLHAAAHGNQKPVAALLISKGANLKAKNASGRTPLAETTIHNATAVAKLLRDHGAS